MKEANITKIYSILKKETRKFGIPSAEAMQQRTNDPFKVLVSTILSSQTKDKITDEASERLFRKVRKADDLEKLSPRQIEKIIYPVSFYRNKARFLKQLPAVLKNKFNSKIPQTIEELTQIPGVGRKVASIVLTVSFRKQAIAVDTHVHRIMNRLGYVKTKTPYETEIALRKKLPKKYWIGINELLVLHGQNICVPISPFCSKCPIIAYCNRIGVKQSR